jgi:hypothetical protein
MSRDIEIDEKLCERLLNFVYPPEEKLLDVDVANELIRLDIDTSKALKKVINAVRKDKMDNKLLLENAKLMALTENERDEYKERIKESIEILKKALMVRSKIEADYSEHTIKLAVDEIIMYVDVAMEILMRDTNICPICCEEKPITDNHENCGE